MQTQLTIEIENLAPTKGTLLTPVWFGFHNGMFDTYEAILRNVSADRITGSAFA